jgi:hypothetical protein
VPSSASIQKSIIPGQGWATTLTHVACGGTRRYRCLVLILKYPSQASQDLEAPARTPTLLLETCVGQEDIVQPDLDSLSPRQQQCSVVFRSAKQDTNNLCLTGHTDAEELIQIRASSQTASVMLWKQDHETGRGIWAGSSIIGPEMMCIRAVRKDRLSNLTSSGQGCTLNIWWRILLCTIPWCEIGVSTDILKPLTRHPYPRCSRLSALSAPLHARRILIRAFPSPRF